MRKAWPERMLQLSRHPEIIAENPVMDYVERGGQGVRLMTEG